MFDAHTEDSVCVYAGLSDATAVPATETAAGWEPALVVNVPAEPSDLDDPEGDEPGDRRTGERTESEAAPTEPQPNGPRPADALDLAENDEEAGAGASVSGARKPAKRKRAAVPSWDEIMFGGPKRPG